MPLKIKGFNEVSNAALRFLVRLVAPETHQDALLSTVRALARSAGAESRNPKWTSYGALELDIFCPTRADFDLFLTVIQPIAELEFVRDLNLAAPYRTEEELFSEARDYFNGERYWECHEALEGIWRLKQGEEKRYLQGVILVCAAFVHHQKGEDEVALGVLRRAANQLEFPAEEYGGFSVPNLAARVRGILEKKQFSNFRL
jgi:hypothetical protein